MTVKEWQNSEEYRVWKNGAPAKNGLPAVKGIVRRRLEKIDELLSSGEWVSTSKMLEEINKLYLDAPNDECYYSSKVFCKIVEAKEGSKKNYERALSLTYAGIVRQDRLQITNILKIVGKEHIYEKTDEGEGPECSYRYNTKYSIFDRYTINDIEFDDYELYKSVPVVLETIQSELKTGEEDAYLDEVANNIQNLDFATTNSINLLSTLDKALKRARAINNNIVSALLDHVFDIYDGQKKGWEKEILKKTVNAYAAASHPAAEFDKGLLYYIRLLIIITKIVDGAESDILDLLKKELKDANNPELSSKYPDVEEFVVTAIKYYVFEFSDYEGMANELEKHYEACKKEKHIIEDYGLMIAIHAFIYPEEWQYHERMHTCLCNLVEFYKCVPERDDYVSWMLLLFVCLKQYMETAKDGKPACSFSDWSRLKFELITSIKPDSIGNMVYEKAPDDDLHAMLDEVNLADQGRFVEYMVLTDMRFDLADVLHSLVDGNDDYLQYISAEEAQLMYEELLLRFTKLDNVFAEAENSALLNCRLSLALLHDSLSHEKEALEYYSSIKYMYDKGDVFLADNLSQLVKQRITDLS